jgi:hypothetical protein
MARPEDNRDEDDPDVYARAYRLRDDLKAAGQTEWSTRINDALLAGAVGSEILGELRASSPLACELGSAPAAVGHPATYA